MKFDAYEVAVELVRSLREVVARLRSRDAKLADEIRRAATSIVLNLAEGSKRAGLDRTHHFRLSHGSAAEVKAALDLAIAWGDIDAASVAPARVLLDRELAMLYRLTH
jgi:four helix bundle protein